MKFLFNNLFFEPLYNALAWLSAIVPGQNIGLAIIILTLLVRLALFPLQHKMSRTQHKIRELDGEIKSLKDKYKTDQAEQARQIMALYRQHGVNPFSGFLLLLIQLPILWALLMVFRGSFSFDPDLIYSFISAPEQVNTILLGLDVSERSWLIAILVGFTQYFQISFSMPPLAKKLPNATPSLKEDLARSMQVQMRYILPVMIMLFSIGLPAAVPIYWLVGNLFSIVHELFVRSRAKKLTGDLVPTK